MHMLLKSLTREVEMTMKNSRMKLNLLILVAFAAVVFTGCPGAGDKNGNSTADNGQPVSKPISKFDYKLAGKFDGKDIPPGSFVEISSVAVTGEAVFVTDRAYSSVYVFDRKGNYLRSIGCGFKIADYMLTDDELMETYYEPQETLPDVLANQIALNKFFRPEGVKVSAGHIFVLNSYYSSLVSEMKLGPCIFEYGMQGQYIKTHALSGLMMPHYFAIDKAGAIAGTDPIKNTIQIKDAEDANLYLNNKLTENLRGYISETIKAKGNQAKIQAIKSKMSNTGFGRDQYIQISGIAAYTPIVDGEPHPESTKFIICDLGNNRLKVVDRNGVILRLVAGTEGGKVLFDSPIDVAIDDSGNIFVLDSGGWVAGFDSNFAVLGSFGKGEITSPVSISVDATSDIWIADRGSAEVLHYSQDK